MFCFVSLLREIKIFSISASASGIRARIQESKKIFLNP